MVEYTYDVAVTEGFLGFLNTLPFRNLIWLICGLLFVTHLIYGAHLRKDPYPPVWGKNTNRIIGVVTATLAILTWSFAYAFVNTEERSITVEQAHNVPLNVTQIDGETYVNIPGDRVGKLLDNSAEAHPIKGEHNLNYSCTDTMCIAYNDYTVVTPEAAVAYLLRYDEPTKNLRVLNVQKVN